MNSPTSIYPPSPIDPASGEAGVWTGVDFSFCIFGTPSETGPWGWQLYGHHLCVNLFVLGEEMVISPVFIGAEPNVCPLSL